MAIGQILMGVAQDLDLPSAKAWLLNQFLTVEEEKDYLEALEKEIPWKHEEAKIFGREVKLPRLTSWHADEGLVYSYSGINSKPQPWLPTLTLLKKKVEDACGCEFNSVLLNFYRDGRDSVGWHADDEKELGPDPFIASVSLGAARRFQFKQKGGTTKRELLLTGGSLLFMGSGSQTLWLHQVPKEKKVTQPRFNLTFRRILVIGKNP